jgi:transposase
MGLERYVVDAVVLEGRSPREIARLHGISKSWIYALLARFHAGGYEALLPRVSSASLLRPSGRG